MGPQPVIQVLSKTRLPVLTAAIFAAALGTASAQTAAQLATGQMTAQVPVPNIQAGALVPVIPQGMGSAQSVFAAAGQVGAVLNYQNVTPVTAFAITPANTTSLLFLTPAGTLATGTVTMPAAPSDGGAFCILDTQIQTALTVSGNTGQTVAGTAVTALTAGTAVCWRYMSLTSTWYRYL